MTAGIYVTKQGDSFAYGLIQDVWGRMWAETMSAGMCEPLMMYRLIGHKRVPLGEAPTFAEAEAAASKAAAERRRG